MPSTFALFAVSDSDAPDRQNPQEWRHVREVTPEEREAVSDARALTRWVGQRSPMSDLEGYRMDLIETIAEQVGYVSLNGSSGIQAHEKTARRFADLLYAFASYDDRTSAWLSSTFGKDSQEFAKFKKSTNGEYDSSTAYRIMRGLRNVSAHGGQVMRTQVRGELAAAGGTTVELLLTIDGPDIAANYASRLNATVRGDLLAAPGPIHVLPAVSAVFSCCLRMHAAMCLSVEQRYLDAVSLLEGLWEEAFRPGVRHVYVTNEFYADLAPDGRGKVDVQPVREFDWDELRGFPDRWRSSSPVGAVVDTIADLCVSPEIKVARATGA